MRCKWLWNNGSRQSHTDDSQLQSIRWFFDARQKQKRLVDLIEQYDIPLIEDDILQGALLCGCSSKSGKESLTQRACVIVLICFQNS